MKYLRPLLRQSRQWLVLLCFNSAFFIWLAWIAYPETFNVLVLSMLLCTLLSIIVGLLITYKKQQQLKRSIHQLLKEPSKEQEEKVARNVGDDQLIQPLAEELRFLKDERQKAKQQSVDYQTFIESWVHEIKTPLSLMNFVLQNRQDEMSPLIYQRLNHANITMHNDVERILFYAKLQATHKDYRLQKISLEECFEDVLLELQTLLEENDIAVQTDIADTSIVTDKRALQFMTNQLVINAIKYRNPKKDSWIRLETGYEPNDDSYFVKVSDNGQGVLASDLPFIFDKGFTGDTHQQKQSTGIGLYLVKTLCDDLNITVKVVSHYEQGFTIQLLFPKV